MFDYERQASITDLLKRKGSMTTAELAATLYVSEATIRRDLAKLEQTGQLRRTHGGAMIIAGPDTEIPLLLRDRVNDTAKQAIAAKAITRIADGDTVMLDASSTVFRVIPLLAQKQNLTVVTNGPKATIELAARHIRTLATGGVVLSNSLAFVGREAEQFIRSVNADVLLISCRGLSPDGYLTDSSLEEANIRKEMLRHARRKYLLCDTSKVGTSYTYNICHVDELDGWISEK